MHNLCKIPVVEIAVEVVVVAVVAEAVEMVVLPITQCDLPIMLVTLSLELMEKHTMVLLVMLVGVMDIMHQNVQLLLQ